METGDAKCNGWRGKKEFRKGTERYRVREKNHNHLAGYPVAELTAIGPREDIEWPEFYSNAIETKGKKLSQIISENREDPF